MHAAAVKSRAENPRLDSWKEIAAYLDRDERTVKRWEKTRGLPVHRLPGGRSGVFAFTGEIDSWQKQGAAVSSRTNAAFENEPPANPSIADATVQPEYSQSSIPRKAASLATRLSFVGRRNYVAVFSLSALIVASSLLLFTHRSGARGFDPYLSPVRSVVITHTPSKDVEDIYLRGRYFWNKRTPSDLNTALALFKEATQRDPSYASAYVGLADTYFLMVEFAALPPQEAYPPAIVAASKAISLDPEMAEAHRSLGFSSFYWDWNRVQSEKEFRKASELDPHDATAHHWFANTLMASQRYKDALNEIELARKLDPTAISILADRGQILSLVGRADEARVELQQIEQRDPSYLSVHWYLAGLYYRDKNLQAYLGELKEVASVTHTPANYELYHAAEQGFTANGERGMSQAIAEAQLSLYRRGLVPAFDVASALASSGRKKEAIQYLKLAYLNRDTQFLTIGSPDVFPMLKNDLEFEELVKKTDQPYQEHAEVADISSPTKYHP